MGNVDLPVVLPPLIENGTEQILTPLVPLLQNTFYRVTIDGTAQRLGCGAHEPQLWRWVFLDLPRAPRTALCVP